jgi:molecular chaperone GrpE
MENLQENSNLNQDIQNDEAKNCDIADTQILQDYQKQNAELKNQIELLQDKLLRSLAESENIKKRLEKSIEDTRDYAVFAFAKDLLSVSDNLTRALQHKPENLEGGLANVIEGIEMTRGELTSLFKKHGLELIDPLLGEKFDCNIHHAVSHIPSDEYEQDCVIATMQSGYKIKDRLVRPAMVQISKKTN